MRLERDLSYRESNHSSDLWRPASSTDIADTFLRPDDTGLVRPAAALPAATGAGADWTRTGAAPRPASKATSAPLAAQGSHRLALAKTHSGSIAKIAGAAGAAEALVRVPRGVVAVLVEAAGRR